MGVEVRNLSLTYHKKKIFSQLNLTIKPGETIGLLGPSGVGKSSLLKVIAGLQPATTGTITFTEGFSIEETVLVFQDYWLFPHLTVWQNIAFGLKMKKIPKLIIEQKVNRIMSQLALIGLETEYPATLSGGQKQRVALARAVVLEPKLLLLDEPFSSLDENLKITTRTYIKKLQLTYGFSILLVTHDKAEAFLLSDKVAVLLNGSLLQIGTPKEIYFAPSNKVVADFIGETNYLPGQIKGTQFSLSEKSNKFIKVNNSQTISGDAWLCIPYGSAIEFTTAITELSGQIKAIHWQPTGNTYQIQIGETMAYFTNVHSQGTIGEYVNIQPLSKNISPLDNQKNIEQKTNQFIDLGGLWQVMPR